MTKRRLSRVLWIQFGLDPKSMHLLAGTLLAPLLQLQTELQAQEQESNVTKCQLLTACSRIPHPSMPAHKRRTPLNFSACIFRLTFHKRMYNRVHPDGTHPGPRARSGLGLCFSDVLMETSPRRPRPPRKLLSRWGSATSVSSFPTGGGGADAREIRTSPAEQSGAKPQTTPRLSAGPCRQFT